MADQPRSVRDAGALRLHDTIRLSAEGLAKVLGDLESRVMHVIWSMARPASARQVHQRVVEQHPVALLTVVTVLNKLVGKGLLHREKRDELLHYEARLTESEFRDQVSHRVISGILSLGPQALTSSLVDVLAERDPEQLAELARLIERRLREQEES